MTSVGYIATFHMAAPTQAAVYENPLDTSSEPPWRWRLRAGWAVFCVADTGSGEGWLFRRRLQGCRLSSSNAGTSVYMAQLQIFRCLGLGLLTGGYSRLGSELLFTTTSTPQPRVASSLIHNVALAKPFS